MAAPEAPVLRTARLLLRPLGHIDLDALAGLYGDHDVMEIRKIGVQDLDGTRKQLAEIVEHWRRYGFGLWAVRERAGGAMIGECGLRYLADGTTVELSYGLAVRHWGKGYATEAAAAALSFGFNDLALDAIVAISAAHNLASQRVMAKLGMRREPAARPGEDLRIVRHRLESKEFFAAEAAGSEGGKT